MSFVDDLENSIDIVDLIGRYAKLKKTGANFKALCPFPGHSEKTPSFVVSPAKQIGYCFGCHKWGWPVKFIMDMENCEFREAVQMLGSITGREIEWFTENKEKIQIKKNLYSLYKDATNYYKQSLERHPEIKKYLIDRWLNAEDISKFHFGYSDSGISLYNMLKDKWYDDDLIAKSAIFLDTRTKKDKFIGRVIFPIQNLRGDFVAFAGRIIGQWEPKYLNSPASDIYDKSSILYGLYDARSTITKVDQIIITEWYMDTIALHRYWFFQTVAVSGTALTEKHITIIKRLTHKIYLCFDNDKAGTQATKSSLELLKNQWLEVKIIVISGAKDPDEYLEAGKDFQELITSALSPIKYLIKSNNYNLASLDEKKKFLDEIMQIIKSYSDSIEQDMYLKELAQVSDTPVDVLYEIFRKTKLWKAPKNYDKVEEITENIPVTSEDIALGYIFENTENITRLNEWIIFELLETSPLKKALADFEDFKKNLNLWQKEQYKALAFQISNKELWTDDYTSSFEKLVSQLNKNTYKQLTQKYKQEMKSWWIEAFQKYSEIVSLAKKHGIK